VGSGGLLVVADPIEVDPASVPGEILKWNKKSVGTTIQYSKTVQEPDEAPIPADLLFDALRDAGMRAKVVVRGWEILPRNLPPSLWDKMVIRLLHKRYGANGNVMVIAAVSEGNKS
jgi:hypothetical protein